MDIVVYGIPNCDTVKKARAWLDARGTAYTFHDYKKLGIEAARLRDWVNVLSWEALLNRRGTAFRKLPDAAREGLDADRAIAIMVEHCSTIKRPVVEYPGGLLLGFRDDEWTAALG